MPEPTFSEKYRGTEFAPPDGEAMPDGSAGPGGQGTAAAPGGPRRRRTAIVVIGLVVAIGTGAGSTALALTQQRPAAPIAGPGGTPAGSAAPSSTSAAVSSSAAPAGAATPAPSGAAPGAPPPLVSESPEQRARRIVTAFGARMLVPDIAYRMTGSGSAKGTPGSIRWTGTWTVAGRSSKAHVVSRASWKGQPSSVRLDSVVIGMDRWVRASGGWKKSPVTGASSLVPFLDLTQAREVVYKGPVVIKGVTYHRLVSTSDYHPSIAKWSHAPVDGLLITRRSLEITVREDGTAVSARFTFTAKGTRSRVTGTATYSFWAVGSTKLVVIRPK